MAKHFANIDVRGDLLVRGIVNDNLRIQKEVEAAAFYIRGVGELLPGSATDHGSLAGLSDDDHPQYARKEAEKNTFRGTIIAEAFYFGTGTVDLSLKNFTNNLEVSVQGETTLIIGPDSIDVDGNVLADRFAGGLGSASLPTHSFSSDGNTGIYNSAADTLGFSAGGVERAVIGKDGMRVNDKIEAEAFYISSGWDLTLSSVDFDVPVVSRDNYFLHSFAPQSFVIQDVKAVTSTGAVTVGFYVIEEGESIHYGVGIPNLDPFYLSQTIKSRTVEGGFVVEKGGSILMSVFENRGGTHLRGRLLCSLLR